MVRLTPLAMLVVIAAPVAAEPIEPDKTGVSLTLQEQPVKRSYTLAAMEVVALNIGLNLAAQAADTDWARINLHTMKQNLEDGFRFDGDPYTTNQLGHPMGGVALFTAVRSLGHGFWVSGLYAFGGSLMWELFMENEQPSWNDQITTPLVGMLLGEPLHRFSRALLDPRYGKPGIVRRVGSVLVDPIGSFNRVAWGNAWKNEVSPSIYAHFGVGYATQTDLLGDTGGKPQLHLQLVAEHGLTGDADFSPKHPLDHFEIRGSLDMNADDVDAEIYTRGLALGRGFGNDTNIRGLGGLFTAYEFSNQELIRHSIVGLGPGATAELTFEHTTYLQGTLAGYVVPWGAAGGVSEEEQMSRDYHRGPGLAALAELRLGRRGLGEIRVTSRFYEIRATLTKDVADERVSMTTVGARLSVTRHHAIGVEGDYSTRRANYSDGPTATDRVAEGRVFYALTTDGSFY